MAEQPLISIITVNRDNVAGLQRTVDSVLQQTWKAYEYIVIDGNSTDGSAEFLITKDSEIDKWVSEPDTGIYNAMNKGIKMATGEYLLFLNSGDHFLKFDILETARKYLQGEEIIYFDVEVIEGIKKYIKWTPEKLSFKFLKKDSLPHQGTFIKSSGFRKIGQYDENYRIISDWKFIALGVLKFSFKAKKVNIVLARFYKDGISTKERKLLFEEREEILLKDFNEYPEIENLRRFKKNILRSKSISILRLFGFLKWIKG